MSELNVVFVDNEKGIETFNSEKLKSINSLRGQDSKFLVIHYSKLIELEKVENELDNIKNEFMKSIYNKLGKIIDEKDFVCPICDKTNDIPIKELINQKNQQLASLQN